MRKLTSLIARYHFLRAPLPPTWGLHDCSHSAFPPNPIPGTISPLRDRETEAQRGEVTCSTSHSRHEAEQGMIPGSSNTHALTSTPHCPGRSFPSVSCPFGGTECPLCLSLTGTGSSCGPGLQLGKPSGQAVRGQVGAGASPRTRGSSRVTHACLALGRRSEHWARLRKGP